MTSFTNECVNGIFVASSGGADGEVKSSVAPMLKQPVPSPTRTAAADVPAPRGSAGSKKEEDEDEESAESESESEESSSEEESTPFVEYDAEPLSKSRTQSRSMARSVADNGDVQKPLLKSPTKPSSPLEPKLPVTAVSNRSPVTSVSPGKVSRSSVGSSVASSEPENIRRVSDRASRLEELDMKSPVFAAAEEIPVLSMSPGARVSQPLPPVNVESTYAGKSQKSPVARSPVPVELDYAGKSRRSPSVRSPVAEPADAAKFHRSPAVQSPADHTEPSHTGKSRNYARMSPPQLEYAEFDREPMSRNRKNIPYADDDDELPPAPVPGSPRKKASSPPVKTPTLTTTLAPPASPLAIQPSFIQTYEAPPAMAPRAAAGPILMPPRVSEPTARIEASPVLHPKPTGYSSQDNWRTSEMPAARDRPPSVSRVSPHPQVETSADAVSQLFMKLETNYTNPPPASQVPVRSQEPSYGPGYRTPVHGAVVRQQEPYPVEVWQSLPLA